MKLSASNIAWPVERDEEILSYLQKLGFEALEIAPTRLFSENPYEKPLVELKHCAWGIKEKYDLPICSMQSIWFGRTERIAGSKTEYHALLTYSEQAIRFAVAIGCRNLVFGCPKNRTVENVGDEEMVKRFLDDAASLANTSGVTLALEANPPIYNTNFVNRTEQAIQIIRELQNPGLMLNLDFGTIAENKEEIHLLENNIDLISHIHISEPYLKPIQRRKEHLVLKDMLLRNGYQHYVSLEMENPANVNLLKQSLEYVKGVFS